jgi:glucosyltransferase
MILSSEEIEKRVSDSYELPNQVLKEVPNPMVSIRTSTYNHGPYIKQCIEGVLMQKTSFPFEYIIGEDFSSDETRDIVFEYAKKYPNIIRVVTADYNVGMTANGQRCIRRCRGKYMAICEGDDYWIDPLKLQKQVDFMENNPEYGLIYTNVDFHYQSSDTSKKAYLTSTKMRRPNSFIEHLTYRSYIAPCTWLLRREYATIRRPKYVDGTFAIALDIWATSKIYFLDEVTAIYRVLNKSASHSLHLAKRYKFALGVFKVQQDYISKYSHLVSDTQKMKVYTATYRWMLPFAILFDDTKVIVDSLLCFKRTHRWIEWCLIKLRKPLQLKFIITLACKLKGYAIS